MDRKKKIELRIGIVGCGNIAKVHLHYVKGLVPLGNIALCDSDQLRLTDFAQTNGISNTYDQFNDMLEKFHPDIVHILTPPSSHRNIAILCMEKGAHILIEKPMCVTIKEADDIIEQAKKFKRMVCVDHMRLYERHVLKFKSMYESGVLGEIVRVSAGYSYDSKARVDTDAASRWRNKLPGSSFFDVMPHPLCLLEEYLPGIQLDRATLRHDKRGEIDELLCSFSSNSAIGTLHMSLNVYPLVNYVIFECTKGTVNIDFRNFLIYVRKSYGLPNAIERIIGNLSISSQIIGRTMGSVFNFIAGKLDPYEGMKRIIIEFYTAIVNNSEKSPVPPQKGKKLLAITHEIFTKEIKEDVNLRPKLDKADVLVTGGTGAIGRRLVNRLLNEGYKVRVFSHRYLDEEYMKKIFVKKVNLVSGDVYNYEDVSYACEGVDTVYHLAAAMKGDWNYHLDTTVSGTKNMLEAAKNKGIKHFIYVSTLNVYDAKSYPNNRQIDETFPYENNPEKRGNYSNAKLKAEKIALEYKEKGELALSIVRPGLVYGHNDIILPKDIGIRVGKRLLVVFGGGRKIPLVYVENLVDALMLLIEKEKQFLDIFNVVDGDYPTQRKYIKKYKQTTGEKFVCLYLPMIFVKFSFWSIELLVSLLLEKKISLVYKLNCISKNVIHSTERIKSYVGWKQNTDFNKGLLLTVHEMFKKSE